MLQSTQLGDTATVAPLPLMIWNLGQNHCKSACISKSRGNCCKMCNAHLGVIILQWQPEHDVIPPRLSRFTASGSVNKHYCLPFWLSDLHVILHVTHRAAHSLYAPFWATSLAACFVASAKQACRVMIVAEPIFHCSNSAHDPK